MTAPTTPTGTLMHDVFVADLNAAIDAVARQYDACERAGGGDADDDFDAATLCFTLLHRHGVKLRALAAGQAQRQGQGPGERCQHSLDMARLRVAELELIDSFGSAPAAQGQVSASVAPPHAGQEPDDERSDLLPSYQFGKLMGKAPAPASEPDRCTCAHVTTGPGRWHVERDRACPIHGDHAWNLSGATPPERDALVLDLQRTADEIRTAGHRGWGNVAERAADRIEADAARISDLCHALKMSGERWIDMGTLLDSGDTYTNAGYCHASGKRCLDAIASAKADERSDGLGAG